MGRPVIVTRALPGARETAARLGAMGFEVISSPAIKLVALDDIPELTLTSDTHLIFTSANGVRFFCEHHNERDHMAWCVGPATLTAAMHAGFSQSESADGNSKDLSDLILRKGPRTARYIHVANNKAQGDLADLLSRAGRTISFAPLYTPISENLNEDAKAALVHKNPVVLIHSQKGAEAFLSSLPQSSQFAVVAISEKAASPFSDNPAGPIFIANQPNEEALLESLKFAALQL